MRDKTKKISLAPSRTAWVRRSIAAVLVAGGTFVLIPASASATTNPSIASCPEVGQVSYTTSQTATYRGDGTTRTYGQAGGELEISLGESVSTGGSISGTTTAEAGVIFAKASVSVGVEIRKDWTNSVTRAYRWTVPSTQPTGWVEAGHRAYNVSYTKTQIVAPCSVKTVKVGTIVGNTSNIQFIHS